MSEPGLASGYIDTDSEDDLPAGWEERTTSEGWVYFANHEEKLTQWNHPVSNKRKVVSPELPYGWDSGTDANNQQFFVDHINKKTTYVDPRLAFAVESNYDDGKIRQKFDASATALHILQGRDLSSNTIIVTGANSGIGFETVRALALHGATVVLACRDSLKATTAINKIKMERSKVSIEAIHCDLSSLKSVKHFTEEFRAKFKSLYALICNAAVYSTTYEETIDGHELTFQVNHLAHFYMIQLLEDMIIKSKPSRIILVSSESHRIPNLTSSKLFVQDLAKPNRSSYFGMLAYNRSKLCNVITAIVLAKRLAPHGVSVFSLHPGNAMYTGLCTKSWLLWPILLLARPFSKSMCQGAATTVYCTVSRELAGYGGLYFNNCQMCKMSDESTCESTQEELWKLSENLIDQFQNNLKE